MQDNPDNTPPPDASQGTPEAVLAASLNIPRAKFKQWRDDGTLKLDEHWIKDGNTFVILPAGNVEVQRLLALPPEPEQIKPARIEVIAVTPGAHFRVLRCRVAKDSQPCSVRLTAPRVFARQFRKGEKLNVMLTATPCIFEYDGAPSRKVKI